MRRDIIFSNSFQKQKQDILSKPDKSSKGFLDPKIEKLCSKINIINEYYTTSSCSGRVVLMIDSEKKSPDLFLKVYHDLVNFYDFKKNLLEIKNENVKFKQEPCIIHIACKDFESAVKIYDKGKLTGWKKSGIISTGKRFVVELNGTERIEFPLIVNGKILVEDIFLKAAIEKANENMKKSWMKIRKLERIV